MFSGSSVAFLFVSAFSFSSPFPVSCSFYFSFSAPIRRPTVSGRFLVSFPFESASNLTPAFPAVFPGRLPFPVPLFPFRVLFALSLLLFSFSFSRSLVPFRFLFVSFRSFSCPLRSLSCPLRSLVFFFGVLFERPPVTSARFCRVCQCFVNKTQQRRFRLHFSFPFAVFPFPVLLVPFPVFFVPFPVLFVR